MARPWIKLYTEMLHDPKVGRLTSDAYKLFVQLMLKAGIVDEDGATDTPLDLSWELRVDPHDLDDQLEELITADLVYVDEDTDTVCVTSWTKRQPPTTSADRMKRHRDKLELKRKQASDSDVTSQKRHSGALDKNRIDKKRGEGDARARANGASAEPSASPPLPEVPEGSNNHAKTFKAITGFWVGTNMQDFLQQRLGERPNWDIVGWAYEQWVSRGYNPRNLRGVLEWYDNRLRDPRWEPDNRWQPETTGPDFGEIFENGFSVFANRRRKMESAGVPQYVIDAVNELGRSRFGTCSDKERPFLKAAFIKAAQKHYQQVPA